MSKRPLVGDSETDDDEEDFHFKRAHLSPSPDKPLLELHERPVALYERDEVSTQVVQEPPLIDYSELKCSEDTCAQKHGGRDVYLPHKLDDGSIVPCYLHFKEHTLTFIGKDFQEVDPERLASDAYKFTENTGYQALMKYIMMYHADPDEEGYFDYMQLINEVYVLSGIQYLMQQNKNSYSHAENISGFEAKNVMSFVEMINYFNRSFETIPLEFCTDLDRRSIQSNHMTMIRFQPFYLNDLEHSINQILELCGVADRSITFTDDEVMEIRNETIRLQNQNSIAVMADKERSNPNANLYARINDDAPCHLAMRMIQTILASKDAIITNVDQEEKVMLSIPISKYTYSPKMTVMGILRMIQADQVAVENYVQFKHFINGVLSGSHKGSLIPLVNEAFTDEMRYIEAKNGVFCCRTCIMFYHRGRVPKKLPASYKYYTDILENINGGKIRAMKYLEHDIDYYGVISSMLGGMFLRTKDKFKTEYEEGMTDSVQVNHGRTILKPYPNETEADRQLRQEQEAYIKEKWENFDDWIHDPDILALLSPLDVRMRAPQKIMQDQRIPRDTYIEILCSLGRAMSGVIGNKTRMCSAIHRWFEERLGHPITDKQEYATIFEGVAGTGKSTFLGFLQRYFSEELVGLIADNRRPIDPYGTIRGRAVVIASDMQKEEQTPVAQGDLKKFISTEAVGHHRLHTDTIILVMIAHFIFAMNDPLPYPDAKGDMLRRFMQIKFKQRISTKMANIRPGDDRSLEQVFDDEDIGRFPVVCCIAHMRRLLNVGNQPYYRANKEHFEVPSYILSTQADYGRMNNSYRAFMLSLEASQDLSMDPEDAKWSVERKVVLEEYKAYCNTWKCPQKKDEFVDRYSVSDFGLKIRGTPARFYGLKFKGLSIEEEDPYQEDKEEEKKDPYQEDEADQDQLFV